MDGSFTCPNCGQELETPPTGPGRHARCSFCNALVEFPFLPRVEGEWKRRRFGRSRWWTRAWWLVAVSVMALVAVAASQALIRAERSARRVSIQRLIDSSLSHEAARRPDLALRDLDVALRAATGDDDLPDADAIRARRRDLAQRDFRARLDGLSHDAREAGSLGDWLDLSFRARSDRDLAPLRDEAQNRFEAAARGWLDDRAARAEREADPSAAFDACEAGAELAAHLPAAERPAAVERFRALAGGLVARRGVAIVEPPGVLTRGDPAEYDKALRPSILASLRTGGYLPPSRSRWAELWSNAPYRLACSIHESFEGSYLGTQNRLTRIEATLTLSGPGGEIWKTVPNARTIVPARGMSSYAASRLALTGDRVDEAERILYRDAFDQIIEKIRGGLTNLPPRPPDAR